MTPFFFTKHCEKPIRSKSFVDMMVCVLLLVIIIVIIIIIAQDAVALSSINVDETKTAAALFSLERVSSLARALDINVFRGCSITAEEWILEKKHQRQQDQERAIRELMLGYDEYGINQMAFGAERPVTFCAMQPPRSAEEDDGKHNDGASWMAARTNGVIGAVDCQVKTRKDNFSLRFFELKFTGGNDDSEEDTNSIPSWEEDHSCKEWIPFPHVYLKNICVDERMRRRGVGLALVRAVKAYALERGVSAIVLDVDPSNESAVGLYKGEGFEFVKTGSMIMVVHLIMEGIRDVGATEEEIAPVLTKRQLLLASL